MSVLRFTAADRDAHGRIKLPSDTPTQEAEPTVPPLRAIDPFSRPALDLPLPNAADQGSHKPMPVAALAAVVGVATILILAAFAALRAPTSPRARPTAVPAPTVAPAPSIAPQPTVTPQLAIAAFWGPGGERAPDVDPGAIISPRARYGETWVSVALDGGGEVWIARSDAQISDADLRALRDLSPPPTPIVVERQIEVAPRCESAADIRFTSDQTVTNDAGVPIGTVQGRSCYSQADAEANAQVQAEAMRNAWRQK